MTSATIDGQEAGDQAGAAATAIAARSPGTIDRAACATAVRRASGRCEVRREPPVCVRLDRERGMRRRMARR